MNILSLNFTAFVLAAFVIYHLLPWGWKRGWLLLLSYCFYIAVDIRFSIVLLILTITNYKLAEKAKIRPGNSFFFYSALMANLLSFGFLKWLTSPYVLFSGFKIGDWILPVGFSFYLLQLISFQIEIRQNKIKEFPSFFDFALYLVYFPKLLAGPIEKPSSFLAKVKSPLLVTNELLGKAFGLILNGLVRKVVIANLLQILVLPLFTKGTDPQWMSLLVYTFVIYNDFAGYTSIIRGVSLLFGIEVSPNFQQPYLARNFSEFWSRWHISLSVWLRETIFFPLSRKLARIETVVGIIANFVIPPIITMLASGLWHGVNLAMVTWGFIHGVFLILERLLYEKWPQLRPTRLSIPGQNISRLVTFFFVSICWIPFSSPGLQPSIDAVNHLFLKPVLVNGFLPIIPLFLIAFSFLLDISTQNSGDELWWQKLAIPKQAFWIVVFLMFVISAFLFQTQQPVSTFIYQGF
jgi:alginate O-acetyltransferase complex protein AlgI